MLGTILLIILVLLLIGALPRARWGRAPAGILGVVLVVLLILVLLGRV